MKYLFQCVLMAVLVVPIPTPRSPTQPSGPGAWAQKEAPAPIALTGFNPNSRVHCVGTVVFVKQAITGSATASYLDTEGNPHSATSNVVTLTVYYPTIRLFFSEELTNSAWHEDMVPKGVTLQ